MTIYCMEIPLCLTCGFAGPLLGNMQKVHCTSGDEKIVEIYSLISCNNYKHDEIKEISVILMSIGNIVDMHPPGGDINKVIGKIKERLDRLDEISDKRVNQG